MEDDPKDKLLNKKTIRESKKKMKQEKNKENQNKKIKEANKIEEISEGKISIKLNNKDKTFWAFYNPAQELNRDLTVLSIGTYMSFIKYRKEKAKKTFDDYKFNII